MRKIERGLSMNLPGSPLSLPWESGAEDARTPDASRLPGVSEAREAFGVRPIYRRFPSGAGQPGFMVPMHGIRVVGSLHERMVIERHLCSTKGRGRRKES